MDGLEVGRGVTFTLAPPIGPVLALGAHADDIEIGAGGLVATLGEAEPGVEIDFAIFTGDETRRTEAERSYEELVGGDSFHWLGAVDGRLPYEDPGAAKDFLRRVASPTPNLVLCPNREDAHQDHRFVAELAWQVCRGATIVEYSIPKWDPEPTHANLFFPLAADVVERKLDHLESHFPSQHDKGWYRRSVFEAVMSLAGVDAGSRYAEPFTIRKAVLR